MDHAAFSTPPDSDSSSPAFIPRGQVIGSALPPRTRTPLTSPVLAAGRFHGPSRPRTLLPFRSGLCSADYPSAGSSADSPRATRCSHRPPSDKSPKSSRRVPRDRNRRGGSFAYECDFLLSGPRLSLPSPFSPSIVLHSPSVRARCLHWPPFMGRVL